MPAAELRAAVAELSRDDRPNASTIEVMHGVNLDQLGNRDPALYGTLTLPELEGMVEQRGRELGLDVSCFQTNYEGEFVEHLHSAARPRPTASC